MNCRICFNRGKGSICLLEVSFKKDVCVCIYIYIYNICMSCRKLTIISHQTMAIVFCVNGNSFHVALGPLWCFSSLALALLIPCVICYNNRCGYNFHCVTCDWNHQSLHFRWNLLGFSSVWVILKPNHLSFYYSIHMKIFIWLTPLKP
jgi:hypothetical protein